MSKLQEIEKKLIDNITNTNDKVLTVAEGIELLHQLEQAQEREYELSSKLSLEEEKHDATTELLEEIQEQLKYTKKYCDTAQLTIDISGLRKELEQAQLEINDWKDSHDKTARMYEKSELSHKETMDLFHDSSTQVRSILAENEQLKAEKQKYETARNIDEWHEEIGDVIWWTFPIEEPPYIGTPLDYGWIENYYTHWTYIVDPVVSEVKGNV